MFSKTRVSSAFGLDNEKEVAYGGNVKGLADDATLSKLTLIEDVLGIKLSEGQLESIKLGWHAFYSNPERYRDSVVVDMVKLSLKG